MLYFFLGLAIGIVLTAIGFCIWIYKARSGEIQIYYYDGGIYPVLEVNSIKDVEKRYLLLKTVKVKYE